jgi:hypothetical protein
VQVVNRAVAVYNKSNGQRLARFMLSQLWSNQSNQCKDADEAEPIALYDHLDNRWVLSQPIYPTYPNGPFFQCIAVSQTPDPLGNYWVYQPFKISDTKFHVSAQLGVWPDGYYMSFDQLTPDTGDWGGAGVAVFERQKMINGLSAGWIVYDLFSINRNYGHMLPADLDGPAPPEGTPNYFAEIDDARYIPPDDAIYIWEFHVDWNNRSNSTFGFNGTGQPNTRLPTAPFNMAPCVTANPPTTDCIPQKNTSQKLDAIGDKAMYRLQYRNFGDHQSLVANQTVDVGGGRTGIRWYEIRDSGDGPVIHQQATYAPGTEYRWVGSAAMDRQGNLAIGYSVSGPNTYPSIRYAGRLISDPLNALGQGEATLKAGGGSQLHSTGFWGNYTMLTVDPTDDCTFWYTNQYYDNTPTDPLWKTAIGSFRFPSCAGAATGHLFGTVTNSGNGAPVAGATVRTGSRTTTTDGAGVFQLYNLPVGTYSLTISAQGYTAKTVSGVVITDRSTTTSNIALQAVSGPDNRRGYLPLVRRPPTPTPLPPTATPTTPPSSCDIYEPNDDRNVNPFGPLISNQTYAAKLCQDDEDNYHFTTATNEQIQVVIHLPTSLVGGTYLYIYDRNDLRQNADICKTATGQLNKADSTILCSIPHAGAYVVRLYTADPATVFDNVNTYTLRVVYQ